MFRLLYLYLESFILDFINRFVSLNIFHNFISFNRIILLFIFITYIGIVLDSRFKLNRKILIFIFILVFFILLNMYKYNDLNLFFKDLYWYSFMLNFSFIVHVLYFHWIYLYFWKKRKEKYCWYISRIAYLLSFSFIVFLLNYIYHLIILYYNNNRENLKYYTKVTLTIVFLNHSILVLAIIIRFFIKVFANYTCLIIGSYNPIKLDFKGFIIVISFFFFCLILCNILGLSRIIFIWIFFFLFNTILIFQNYYKWFTNKFINFNKKDIIKRFIFKDFSQVLWEHIDKNSWNYLLEIDGVYFINYKQIYNEPQCNFIYKDAVLREIVETFNNEYNLKNILYYLLIYKNYNWFSIAYSQLLDIDPNLNKEAKYAEFNKILKKYNLNKLDIALLEVKFVFFIHNNKFVDEKF